MSEEVPVSLGELINEITQLAKQEPNEYRVSEILEASPGLKMTTVRNRLKTLEKQGKASSRVVNGVTVWKLVQSSL